RLEQGGLSLRRRAVDLVAQEEVREDGSGLEAERALGRAEDARARDVRRHEVGRELDATIGPAERARERAHEQGLRDAGRALEERVAAAQDRDQAGLDLGFEADDGAADLLLRTSRERESRIDDRMCDLGCGLGSELGFLHGGSITARRMRCQPAEETIVTS